MGDIGTGFTMICKNWQDFGRFGRGFVRIGRRFMRIYKTLGEDLQGFARLWKTWQKIYKDL